MAKIDVYSAEMTELAARLNKIASELNDAAEITGKVQKNLNFRVAAKQGISSGLRKTKINLQKQKSKVRSLSDLAVVSDAEFRYADGQIDKKTLMLLRKMHNPAVGIVRDIKDFFTGISIKEYAMIASLFAPAGSIVSVVGLRELCSRLAVITTGGKTGSTGSGTGAGPVQTTPPVTEPVQTTPPAPVSVQRPSAVNAGSSKQNAENAGINYYSQGKDAGHWSDYADATGKNYGSVSSKACAICCEAMIASYYGVNVSPSELIAANDGSVNWDANGATKLLKKNGLQWERVTPQNSPLETAVKNLDAYLEKRRSEPENYAPVMVSIPSDTPGQTSHFVVVTGKDENGNYIIVDPADEKRSTLKISTEKNGKTWGNANGYECPIKGIFTWTKK